MLIRALCDYYDILAKAGKVLPDGYSPVKAHYLVCLTAEGKIDEILDYCDEIEFFANKGNKKEKRIPREVVMFQRTEKSGIDANIVEHRPLYLFGLNYVKQDKTSTDGGGFTPEDVTHKAEKSHKMCVVANLKFIEGVDSPVVNAYRCFLRNWNPADETENKELLKISKGYEMSKFIFCLSGSPDRLLHEDSQLKLKWDSMQTQNECCVDTPIFQCAISGGMEKMARIHNKIKGIYGGLSTGSALVSFNNNSEESYGQEQSFNSNISEQAMKKYTKALNYLIESRDHKVVLDDFTVVFWAMNAEESCEDSFMAMVAGKSNKMDASATEQTLKNLLRSGKDGNVVEGRLQSLDMIDPAVDFYMVGLKPNVSRIAVAFLSRKKYVDVLWNVAMFQQDMQISENLAPISLFQIQKELISPKSESKAINPSLLAKFFEAVLYGTCYPVSLLETVIKRVKVDAGNGKINRVRAGLIKACINRNYKKEEFGVTLNKENHGQAYLCGRLFAVLEKLQIDASSSKLNRTIKDSYFASASSKPSITFPKLLRLAQNHLNKLDGGKKTFYNKMIGEIIDCLRDEFPDVLLLADQGRFMIGYYQQYQSFFEKCEKIVKNTEEKKED